jgi:integrase
MVGGQIAIQLQSGQSGDRVGEVTHRDIEVFRYCERKSRELGVPLVAAIEEWSSARKIAGEVALSEAVRLYLEKCADLVPVRSLEQVVLEFLESRRASGVTKAYVQRSREYLARFTGQVSGNIGDVSVAMVNRFFQGQKTLGPVTKNAYRRCLVTMFGFAKRQGYLDPAKQTAAQLSVSFKEPVTDIEIFTVEEMEKLLLTARERLLPVVAIGAFAGIRSAEIGRLNWEDIKWDRGHIELAGRKTKNRSRRLAPLSDNLKAWLAPWRYESGQVVTLKSLSGALTRLGGKSGMVGGWRKNALRHSYISYRVALTCDVARTALEAGNSPEAVFRHYRELVDGDAARAWFSIRPPSGWQPKGPRKRV